MRLMILGGGSSQRNAFRRARELGFETILADRDPAAPARPLADRFVAASTFDIDAVTEAAAATGAEAILAVGTDQPVYTAAIASRRLGLPFPLSPRQAAAVTNKRIMKERFRAAGIPTARSVVVDDDTTRWRERGFHELRPPYVVKPVDSQGQRGIIRAETPEQVAAHIPVAQSHSRETNVLVEEYYPSREVTVSGWAHAPNEVEIWTITDRVTFDNPPGLGVCPGHRYPSYHAGDRGGEIERLTREIVAAFQLAGGPIYFQMLVGDDGVLVNEIAVRLGGAYEDQSIEPVTGVDVLQRQLTAIRNAVAAAAENVQPGAATRVDARTGAHPTGPRGADPTGSPGAHPTGSPGAAPPYRYFSVPLIFARPGTVAALTGDAALRDLPGVTDCRFLLPVGTVIRPMENSTQRIAYAVLHGNSADEINTLVDTVFDTLTVRSTDGADLLIDARASVKHPSA